MAVPGPAANGPRGTPPPHLTNTIMNGPMRTRNGMRMRTDEDLECDHKQTDRDKRICKRTEWDLERDHRRGKLEKLVANEPSGTWNVIQTNRVGQT